MAESVGTQQAEDEDDYRPERLDVLDTGFIGLYSEEEFDQLLNQLGI